MNFLISGLLSGIEMTLAAVNYSSLNPKALLTSSLVETQRSSTNVSWSFRTCRIKICLLTSLYLSTPSRIKYALKLGGRAR